MWLAGNGEVGLAIDGRNAKTTHIYVLNMRLRGIDAAWAWKRRGDE